MSPPNHISGLLPQVESKAGPIPPRVVGTADPSRSSFTRMKRRHWIFVLLAALVPATLVAVALLVPRARTVDMNVLGTSGMPVTARFIVDGVEHQEFARLPAHFSLTAHSLDFELTGPKGHSLTVSYSVSGLRSGATNVNRSGTIRGGFVGSRFLEEAQFWWGDAPSLRKRSGR